jgi:hypothetical protein
MVLQDMEDLLKSDHGSLRTSLKQTGAQSCTA